MSTPMLPPPQDRNRCANVTSLPSRVGDFGDDQDQERSTARLLAGARRRVSTPAMSKQPTNRDAGIDDQCHQSNSSSRPYRIAALRRSRAAEATMIGVVRASAIFSSAVSGAAAVITSRSSCSSEWPLMFRLALETFDHPVVEIADKNLAPCRYSRAIINDSVGLATNQVVGSDARSEALKAAADSPASARRDASSPAAP